MGPGFESLRVYKISESLTIIVDALLAQLVEQLTLNQWVQGSNPWGCTEAVRQNEEKLWKSIGFQSFFYAPTWQNTEVFSRRNNTYSWDFFIESKSPTKVNEVFSCFSNGKYFRNENKSFFEWFVSDFFVGLFIVNEKAHNSVCISLFFNVLLSSILRI